MDLVTCPYFLIMITVEKVCVLYKRVGGFFLVWDYTNNLALPVLIYKNKDFVHCISNFFSLDFEYLINEYDGCEGP